MPRGVKNAYSQAATQCALYLIDNGLREDMTKEETEPCLRKFLTGHALYSHSHGKLISMTESSCMRSFSNIATSCGWPTNGTTQYQRVLALCARKDDEVLAIFRKKEGYDRETFRPDNLPSPSLSTGFGDDTAEEEPSPATTSLSHPRSSTSDSVKAPRVPYPVGKRGADDLQSPSGLSSKRAKHQQTIPAATDRSQADDIFGTDEKELLLRSPQPAQAKQREPDSQARLPSSPQAKPQEQTTAPPNEPTASIDSAAGSNEEENEKERIGLKKIQVTLNEVFSMIETTAIDFLKDIRLKARQESQLPSKNDFGPRLLDLFATCFGPEYESNCKELSGLNRLSVPEVFRALIGAFIFHHILQQDVAWRNMKLQGASLQDQAALTQQLFDLVDNFLAAGVTQSTRRDALGLFAQKLGHKADDGIPASIKLMANQKTAELITALEPYIARLAQIANSLDGRVTNPQDWQPGLQNRIAEAIDKAAQLRIELWRSKMDHTFSWPASGTDLDPATMKPVHSSATMGFSNQQVAFALFSSVTPTFIEGEQSQRVRQADVISRARSV